MMYVLKNILFRTVIVCLATVYCLLAGHAQSQPYDEDWRWVQFTTESGLPSNHIYHLVETKDGTVWVGTANGVAWFDGFKWRAIDTLLGLPQENTSSVFCDSNDQIFVLMGRRLFSGNQYGFNLLPIENVENAVAFQNGSILILCDGSLYVYNKGKINYYSPEGISVTDKAANLWKTTGGSTWLVFRSGLYKWERNTWMIKLKSEVNRLNINCIAENELGSGMISVNFPFEYRGLWEWNSDYLSNSQNKKQGDFIRTMDINSKGEAIAVYFSGEMKIRLNNVWRSFVPKRLELKYVEMFHYRKNGDIWALTSYEGLFLYRKTINRWNYHRYEGDDPRNRVHEMLRAKDSSLWFGTADGVDIIKRQKRTSMQNIGETKLFVITGIAEENNGNIWISSGSAFEGAFCWNGSAWKHYNISDSGKEIRVHKIRKDRQGRLWFLGLGKEDPLSQTNQPGAYVYENGKFTRWGTDDGLLNDRIYSFAEGLNGEFWFGTYGGISRWNNGKWNHWTQNNGLRSNKIFSVAVDSSNKLWFADRVNGLGFIDENDKIEYFTTQSGTIHNFVWDINVDFHGKLYYATSGGLGSFYKGQFFSYNYNSGLINPQLWPVLPEEHQVLVGTMGSGVAILNLDEEPQPPPKIFLEESGSQESSAFLRWKALAYWGQPSPKEILTRYRVGEGQWSIWSNQHDVSIRNIDPGTYSYQVQAKGLFGDFNPQGATGTFTIPLPYYRHPLTILSSIFLVGMAISILSTLAVRKKRHNQVLIESEEKFRAVAEATASAIFIYQNARFQYFNPVMTNLVGYTNEELSANSLWKLIKPAQVRSVRPAGSARDLSWLIPGHYEFTVNTKDGIERSIDLTIGEVEYRGKPAKLGTAFDITERKKSEQTIMVYQDQLRTLASALSMAEEKERRRLASLLHDRIGQTLAYCKIKLGAYQAAPNPNSSMAEIKEIRNLIDQSIVDTRSLTSELSPPVLYELGLLKAVEWLAEEMNRKYNVHFTVHRDADSNLLDEESEIILYHAIRELMMNIIKHAHVGTAHIKFKRSERYFFTQTEDQGAGFNITNNESPIKGNNGFGLFSIRERLSHIGGSMEIVSSPGNGTKVILTVPFTRITKKQKGHNAVD